jgi:4-hydroxymandelate oxidase
MRLATSPTYGSSASSSSSFLSRHGNFLAVIALKTTTLLLLNWWRHYRKHPNEENERQYQILLSKIPPKSILEFEAAAMQQLGPLARVYFQYFSEQPSMELQGGRQFLQSLRLSPTILTGDVRTIDSSLTIFGQRLELPVWIAPSAFHVLACPEGEIATAQAAGAAGAGYCYNWMLSSKHYKEVLPHKGVKWLHLYMFEERDLVQACIQAALQTKQFSAIILTCDHPHTRVQNRMMPYFTTADMPHADPDDPFFPNQAAVGFDKTTLRQLLDRDTQLEGNPGGTNSSQLSWEDVKWIRASVPSQIPIVAKGILTADDALRAIDAGVDAIVVSNHGGRQCDIAVPAMEALPVIADAVQDRVPILVDSGIRSSGDIVKALCLGASGVMLGRPPLWALACGGAPALQRMLETLKQDLQDDLRSLGVTSIQELGLRHLWAPDQKRIELIVQACKQKRIASRMSA